MANDNAVSPPPTDDIASWFIMTYTRLPLDSKAHRELVARITTLQAERDRLRAALGKLCEAADNGEWHSSGDCKVEEREDGCGLCQALSMSADALREGGE